MVFCIGYVSRLLQLCIVRIEMVRTAAGDRSPSKILEQCDDAHITQSGYREIVRLAISAGQGRCAMMTIDSIGYVAASLVLATFCARTMVLLRALAIASNLAFIAYGLLAHLWPILLLHAVMLPLNVYRLLEAAWTNPSLHQVRQ